MGSGDGTRRIARITSNRIRIKKFGSRSGFILETQPIWSDDRSSLRGELRRRGRMSPDGDSIRLRIPQPPRRLLAFTGRRSSAREPSEDGTVQLRTRRHRRRPRRTTTALARSRWPSAARDELLAWCGFTRRALERRAGRAPRRRSGFPAAVRAPALGGRRTAGRSCCCSSATALPARRRRDVPRRRRASRRSANLALAVVAARRTARSTRRPTRLVARARWPPPRGPRAERARRLGARRAARGFDAALAGLDRPGRGADPAQLFRRCSDYRARAASCRGALPAPGCRAARVGRELPPGSPGASSTRSRAPTRQRR